MPDPDESAIREIQAGVYGSDAGSDNLRDRLDRLVGHRVKIKGDLFPAQTGYHRINVQFCGLSAFPTHPVIIKLRCTKKP